MLCAQDAPNTPLMLETSFLGMKLRIEFTLVEALSKAPGMSAQLSFLCATCRIGHAVLMWQGRYLCMASI